MKFISILLVLVLALSTATASKVSSRNRNRGALGNLWYFACGAAGKFIGMDINPQNPLGPVKNCLRDFINSNGADESKGLETASNGNSIVRKILDFKYKWGCVWGHCVINVSTDGLVGKICSYSNQIIGVLGGRRFRRRFFLQVSVSSMRAQIKRALNKVWAGRGRRGILDGIKSAVASLLRPVLDRLKGWLLNYIQNIPIVKKILNAFQCLKGLGAQVSAAVATARRRAVGLFNAIKKLLTGWKGFIQVIIKTICNWGTFKQAILDLVDAFSNNGQKRWYKIGQFTGGVLAAMGDAFA